MHAMTRGSWLAGLLLGLACASHASAQTAPPASATPAPPALSEAQQCGAERLALQAQVVELRAQLVALQTQVDRDALARSRQDFEAALALPAGWRWDWTLLRAVSTTPEGERDR